MLAAILLASCTSQPSGDHPTDSSRIVSLSGDITEILFEIGAGDRVVGVDVTTVWPAEALSLPVVGVGRFVTAEGVLRERPTLVLGDTQSGPAAVLDQLRQAGVEVKILPVSTSFDVLYDKVGELGALVGEPGSASDLVARIRSEVEEATAGVGSTGLRVAFIYTRGPDVMLLFGDGMVTRPLIEASGAEDAGAAIGVEGSVSVTAEALVRAAPDVIIVPEEGLSITGGIDAFLARPGVGQTPAGRDRAILAYPEGDILTMGPRVGTSLRRLIEDLRSLRP